MTNPITRETRRASYDQIKLSIETRQNNIYEFLSNYEEGLTANELASQMYDAGLLPGWDRNFVHPRLNELVKGYRVLIEEKRTCSISGKTCGVYKVIPEGQHIRMVNSIAAAMEEQDLFIMSETAAN